jgi:eukaryotic-like serine/threonine-protein kinase
MRYALLGWGLGVLLAAVVGAPAPARAAAIPDFPQQADGQLFLPLITTAPPLLDVTVEVQIPAGSFQMGCDGDDPAESCQPDEQPLHTVSLGAYAIDKFEVTNARYQACVAEGYCTAPGLASSRKRTAYYGNVAYADYPVIWVNWKQATAFCDWAGKRLPTEAEWEMAARGSSDTRTYPWGTSLAICAKANFDAGNPVIASYCAGDTSLVGSHAGGASPYGVMDMAGNVAEWVNDWYGGSYYASSPASDPAGPVTGTTRVVRGGSWGSIAARVRVASRYGHSLPVYWNYDVGFRCVRSQ